MTSGIYKITCLVNNKIYIGSTENLEKRRKKHFQQLENKTHINPHLKNAYNLYGKDSFVWEVIEFCAIEELLVREQYWMDLTKCYDREIGFNNTIKADRPLGYKHTEESRKKMSENKKGRKIHPNTLEALKKANTNRVKTEEEIKKMSESKIGNKNPRFGFKEDEDHKKERMKNMLSKPRWNKGLTKEVDSRLEKLAFWKGKVTVNAQKCRLTDLINGGIWEAPSVASLSLQIPISLSSLIRLKNGKAGDAIAKKYKFELL